MRDGRLQPALALAIVALILIGVGILLYHLRTSPIASTGWRIFPGLTEEIAPEVTVASLSTEVGPGKIFELYPTASGWGIRLKQGYQLVERLTLNNVELRPGDTLAPDLWDWYFDGVDDRVYVYGSSSYDFQYLGAAVWFRPEKVRMRVFGKGMDGVGVFSWAFWVPKSGVIYAGVRTNNGTSDFIYRVYTTGTISLGSWYTALVSYDGSYLKLRVSELGELQSVPANYDIVNNYNPPIDWGPNRNPNYEWFKGRISSILVWDNPIDNYFSDIESYVIPSISNALVFCDATFYNGTHYINIFNETMPCIAENGVARVPAENPHLWLVKQLESDNKLHFKWFPSGTIIKIKDSSGNVVREFTIDGAPVNNDGQIEDYVISLDTTTLPSATIEAYVPSFKVRVYGPYGATVKITGSDGTCYGEGIIGTSGYVDIALVSELENADIVIAADDYKENALQVLVEEQPGSIIVKVLDDKQVLVPGMLVRLADPSNVVFAAEITGQDGQVEFQVDRPLPEVTVEVSGVWNNVIHYTVKTVQLSAEAQATTISPSTSISIYSYRYVLVGLFVFMLIALLVMVRRR